MGQTISFPIITKRRRDEPIITSLLDNDFYEEPMGEVLHQKHPKVPITMGLTNRTKSVRLAERIDMGELREQLDAMRQLRFDSSEIRFLRGLDVYGLGMFSESNLQRLENYRVPGYSLENRDGQIHLEFAGDAPDASRAESPTLAIISELYTESLLREMSVFEQERVYAEGQRRMAENIKLLKEYPDLTFSDFGTRRRALKRWHEYVVKTYAAELPKSQIRGTSNTHLAMQLGLDPMGTNAHKMTMIYSGIYREMDDKNSGFSQIQMLKDWWDIFGVGLSIFLPDTFGSDFFLRVLPVEMARAWKGFRHDSGDPFVFGEKIIQYYKSLSIDPRTKLIVFSDGLDVRMMIKLFLHFKGRINVTFGIGTNLTNDIGFKTLSIVIKAIQANGYNLAKLSDNIEKAIGLPEEIERWKRLAEYYVEYTAQCIV